MEHVKSSKETQIKRLRTYLRDLPPHMQAQLLHEIESKTLSTEFEFAFAKFTENELRILLHNSEFQQDRLGNPSRLFFKPLEPFLVSDAPDRDRGQVPRSVLKPIWAWISHKLLPNDTKNYCEAVKTASSVSDATLCGKIAQAFREKVVNFARRMLATPDRIKKTLTDLTSYLAPPTILKDLIRILSVFKVGSATEAPLEPLPKSPGLLARKTEHRY